ncbi:DnaK family protein, partial [Opisthorchis viverrini]
MAGLSCYTIPNKHIIAHRVGLDGKGMPVIGIDIGTSYSCVGTVVDGQVRLFPTEKGNNLLPSIVAFDQGRCLVGEAAKSKLTESPENVIYDIARIIGRSRADKHLTLDEKKWPFCISEHQGRVGVNVTHKNQPTTFTAEEILAILLMHLKQMAQTALRKPVGEAVICIPAHFNNQQRLATTSAARIAGLKVTQLISAPAAAAIAYRREMNIYKEQKLLVLVMGGGTCDVSVITTKDDIIQVDATAGDCHLGGTDLDANLADYLVDQFRTKYGKDFSANHVAVQRLRLACETAKRTLSVSARAHVSIPDIHENLRLSARLTRTEFESMNADIFNKILNLVELVVEDAMITKNSIDDIVLVGGSSWIPKVQEVLTTFFDASGDCHNFTTRDAPGAEVRTASYKIEETYTRQVDQPKNDQCIKEITNLLITAGTSSSRKPVTLGAMSLSTTFTRE